MRRRKISGTPRGAQFNSRPIQMAFQTALRSDEACTTLGGPCASGKSGVSATAHIQRSTRQPPPASSSPRTNPTPLGSEGAETSKSQPLAGQRAHPRHVLQPPSPREAASCSQSPQSRLAGQRRRAKAGPKRARAISGCSSARERAQNGARRLRARESPPHAPAPHAAATNDRRRPSHAARSANRPMPRPPQPSHGPRRHRPPRGRPEPAQAATPAANARLRALRKRAGPGPTATTAIVRRAAGAPGPTLSANASSSAHFSRAPSQVGLLEIALG